MACIAWQQGDPFGQMTDSLFDEMDHGSQLLGDLEVSAWEVGFREIRLTIQKSNRKALAFYFSHGYRIRRFNRQNQELMLVKPLFLSTSWLMRLYLTIRPVGTRYLQLEHLSSHLSQDMGIELMKQSTERADWHRWL